EQQQIWLDPLRIPDRVLASCAGADDVEVGSAQQRFERGADHRMIVGEQDPAHSRSPAIGSSIVNRVTPMPRDRSSAPPASSTRSRSDLGIRPPSSLSGYA